MILGVSTPNTPLPGNDEIMEIFDTRDSETVRMLIDLVVSDELKYIHDETNGKYYWIRISEISEAEYKKSIAILQNRSEESF